MADNRERARALCEEHRIGGYECISVSSNVGKMVFHPNRYALAGITAALDAAFSRGSASIADEARPSVEDLERFIVVFRKLEGFEATQRYIRKTGAFPVNACPDPAVVRVVAWLKDMIEARAALAAIPAPPAPLKERGEATS